MRHNLFLGVAAVALIAPAGAMAQETTSAIRGTVTAAGAPVAGATVTARETASGTTSSTTTDANGGFSLSGLRPGGTFTVDVQSPQGAKQVTDIYTVVGQTYSLPIDVAAADEGDGDIVVTASSIAGAGVTSDGPQTVLNARDISKVASVNRNVRDLARRDPFAALDLTNGQGAVSFAGVNPRFNRFTIDGVQVGDTFGLNSDANPTNRGPVPFDAIGQFSVSIAPYDIRQGNFLGGVIDTTLKSGTNTFTGTGFYSQSTDGLQGDRIGSNRITLPKYKSETYGATIAGPLIKDKLFFMVSAERNTDPRPLSIATLNQIPGYNQGVLDEVINIANTQRYGGYATGDFVTINNQKDEKIVGKIDWNITDNHRLSLSYINAYEESTVANGTSANNNTPVIGLASNYYQSSNLLRAGIAKLNSDWTDQLSTEARFLYRSTRRGQDPLLGTGYPQIRVCTDPTSIVNGTNTASTCGVGVPTIAFGPDNSRQANELFFDTWGGSFLTRYSAGSHELKFLVEYNENRSRNLFVQNATGSLYFDSITDFQNGRASAYNLQVALNGDINSAAADFKYGQYTFGFQDDWAITDRLTLTYGARYDLYGMRTQVPLNSFYLARYNFPNTKTFKGMDNFQPRISANWQTNDWLSLRGGVGVFGGGSPDVYLSNSFSTTGVLTNALNSSTSGYGVIRSNTNPALCGTGAALCGILDNVVAPGIPQAAVDYLRNNVQSLELAPTSSLAQDLRLPSVLKATFSADAKVRGVNLGADFLYTDVLSAPSFTDLRVRRVGTLPDGRPRYAPRTTLTDGNSDFLFYNEDRGRSFIFVVRGDKRFDFGLSVHGSYTWQDVKDVSPATSSTASSLYGNAAMIDPNVPAYGISNDQIKWAFKYGVGFDRALFGDYRTAIQLFGETRAGRPFSFTMQDNNNGRSPVFGTIGNNDRYLMYVPTSTTDPLVSYDSEATRNGLEGLINRTSLKDYRGRIAGKNIARNRAFTRIDLHVEQEIPTFVGGSRITLFGDIENLPNLLNSNWGGLRQLGFPYTAATVQVQCLNATGGALTGAIGSPSNGANACAQYRYSNFREPNTANPSINNSLYLIRLGARFTF